MFFLDNDRCRKFTSNSLSKISHFDQLSNRFLGLREVSRFPNKRSPAGRVPGSPEGTYKLLRAERTRPRPGQGYPDRISVRHRKAEKI